MATYWQGKGYGVSSETDYNGRPFLTYQGPNDRQPVVLYDRVAQTFDVTVPQTLPAGAMKNDRFDAATSAAIKQILGGGADDELDHKISLELGGSNSPANLWIQHGITAGASAASDTLENNLALDVVNGKISLAAAWATLSQQKNFLLEENMQVQQSFSWSDVLPLIRQLIQFGIINVPTIGIGPFSITNWLFGSAGQSSAVPKPSQIDQTLANQLKADIAAFRAHPLNQPLLTKIFQEQVQVTSQQLQISQAQAGDVVRSYLANYAQSKGIDARSMLAATNADIQKIVNQSLVNPNIFGIDSGVILKITGALQGLGLASITLGSILVVVAMFTVGWETALAAISSEGISFLLSLIGLTGTGAIGIGAIEMGAALTLITIAINMTIKEVYDTGYLLPTQQISALKDALAIQKGLAGFLPSTQTATPSSHTPSQTGGGGTAPGIPPQLFIGHISQGTLSPATPIALPQEVTITSADTLASAALHAATAFLTGFPSMLAYEIKAKTSVIMPDGSLAVGTKVRVQKGTTKTGKATYRTVTNKFAAMEIYALTPDGKRRLVDEIILGPIDETQFAPSLAALADLANQLQGKIIAPSAGGVSSINLTPTQPQGAGETPAPTAAPTPSAPPTAPPTQTQAPVIPTPVPPAASTPAPQTNHYFYWWPAASSYLIDGQIKQSAPDRGTALTFAQSIFPSIIDKGNISAAFGDFAGARAQAANPTAQPTPTPATTGATYPRIVHVNVASLYVRAAPTTSAALAGTSTLFNGDQFTVTGYVTGESVSGENRWWTSALGHYVWVGGTAEKP